MTLPVVIIVLCVVLGIFLISLTIFSLMAWYGATKVLEEQQRRLMRSAFHCPGCDAVMRFDSETIE